MYAVHQYLISVDGAAMGRLCPAQCDCTSFDPSKRDIRRLGHVNTKDVDEIRDRLPESLP